MLVTTNGKYYRSYFSSFSLWHVEQKYTLTSDLMMASLPLLCCQEVNKNHPCDTWPNTGLYFVYILFCWWFLLCFLFFLRTPTWVLTYPKHNFYGQGPACCWNLLPQQTIAICSDFYNTSVCMFQIPLAKRLEREGLLSLSGIPGIPSQAREPEACHETVSQPHAVHVFLHQDCE